MDKAPLAVSAAHGALARLEHLGVLALSGADVTAFLHSQLTASVTALPANEARLAGYCSAKGRLLAIFLLWRAGETTYVVVERELAAALAKRLALFVLRAKVRIADLSEERPLYGYVGPSTVLATLTDLTEATAPVSSEESSPATQPPGVPGVYPHVETDRASVIALPDVLGEQRALILPAAGRAGDLEAAGTGLVRLEAQRWRWLEIRAGMPSIVTATQDRFVPQMLNLEVLGGVDFKKGCYPGQEVVARSQYLGKLKRRMTLAHIAEAIVPRPGDDIYHSSRGDEPLGTVVAAEAAPESGTDLLAELPLDLLETGTLHLGAQDGPALALLPLPYSLPQNEVFVRPRL